MSKNVRTNQNAVKSIKKRRSLKKLSPDRRGTDSNTLAIDMSKPEMDAIFTGLNTGTLENPQLALQKVYMLAIDAVSKTLSESLEGLCSEVLSSAQNIQNNPLAPWISKFIPGDPDAIDSFKKSFAEKIEKSKKSIQESIENTIHNDAGAKDVLCCGGQKGADMLREFTRSPEAFTRIPALCTHLSHERLEQIFRDIQITKTGPEENRRYKITQTPTNYRFSINTRRHDNNDDALNPQASAEKKDQTDEFRKEIKAADTGTERETATTPAADAQIMTEDEKTPAAHATVSESSGTQNETSVQMTASPIAQAVTSDINNMASEITGVIREIALQITDAAIAAYAEDNPVVMPSLCESLKNDPRLEVDDALSDFIHDLEMPDNNEMPGSYPDDDSIDNDELARAFEIILNDMNCDEG